MKKNREMLLLARMVLALPLLPLSLAFQAPAKPLTTIRIAAPPSMLRIAYPPSMLRNIDACEAVIFVRDSAIDSETGEVRNGVTRLIAEAAEAGALIAVLEPSDRPIEKDSPLRTLVSNRGLVWTLAASEPAIAEVTQLRKALNVATPDGFGGSDGFGQAPGLAYEREPIAARCVVLVTSLAETVAAIGAGMRSIALPVIEGDWVDESLEGVADICLDAIGEDADAIDSLRIDDLSTPGAYWLNPSMPRTLSGNWVDPETGFARGEEEEEEQQGQEQEEEDGGSGSISQDEEEDAALRALLEDVDPRPSPLSPPPPPPRLAPPPPPPPPRRAVASSSRSGGPPRAALEVTPAEAAALLLRNEGTPSPAALLIDVRQAGEYRLDGHVDGSLNLPAYTWEHGFHLPNEDFAAQVTEAAASDGGADTQIVLLCADGRLSMGAAAVLEAASFTNVCTLDGGLNAWAYEAEEEESEVPPLVIDEDGEGGLTGAWV